MIPTKILQNRLSLARGDKLKLRNVIKQRLQFAEHGRWDVLLKHYMVDLALANVRYKVQIPSLMGI